MTAAIPRPSSGGHRSRVPAFENNVNRVVITGMGIVAPNAVGLEAYRRALCEGKSGIRQVERMRDLALGCQVAGVPQVSDESTGSILGPNFAKRANRCMQFAAIASVGCWLDAGLSMPAPDSSVDWNTGAIIGTSFGGIDTIGDFVAPETMARRVRQLGSSATERAIASCMSACVGGILGLGGTVTTNSSACATGTEAIVDAYWMIREGRMDRVLAGSSEADSIYSWACLDALRVLTRKSNDRPQAASRPMSATAGGLVPAGGAGILMLESLPSAQSRGARVYAEILGGNFNSGGQRNGGSITASNPEGIVRCVKKTLEIAETDPSEVDYVNGHLTGTTADAKEIRCVAAALNRGLAEMPWVNSTKSMIGHGLGASGSMEAVATVLQLAYGFLHPSINSEDLHVELADLEPRVPRVSVTAQCRVALKTSLGFGDVNASVIFRRWQS